MPPGSFLIRQSQTREGFALSVRGEDGVILHYHIKTVWSEEDTSYYITSALRFPSLARLVQHYRDKAGGLCCLLTYPCGTAEQLLPPGHPQNAGQYPQETSCYVEPSSCLRASQKKAEGNRQIQVSLTIFPALFNMCENRKKVAL